MAAFFLRVTAAAVLFCTAMTSNLIADDDTVSSLIARKQRETLQEVVAFLQAHPQAPDRIAGQTWVLETARKDGLEDLALGVAQDVLQNSPGDPAVSLLAVEVACLGLAKTGQTDNALDLFQSSLRGVRPQAASRHLDFAHTLAAAVRLNGDFASARDVYEKLASAFPLNPLVGEIAQIRIGKLELAGKPAPGLTAKDLAGETVDLGALQGKVVVLDFWATNCPPCIAEMPALKALHQKYHSEGLEIIGISLDQRASDAQAYRDQEKLPWQIVMDEQDSGSLRPRFRVETIPSLFVIDQQGNIAQVDVYGANLRATVERLLKK